MQLKIKKKTVISTGVGSCTQAGTTDSSTFYCGFGQNCNNWAGLTCFNPVTNNAAATVCTSAHWQCSVNIELLLNAKKNRIYSLFNG